MKIFISIFLVLLYFGAARAVNNLFSTEAVSGNFFESINTLAWMAIHIMVIAGEYKIYKFFR